MGLLGLVATGVCSMIGAGINVVPIMIQRNVPGIGPYVMPAYALAVVPAIFAALAYAILASAMPRAGGSYVYASRALHPFLGFMASFSQWFGLSIVIGVVAYLIPPFLRDIATALELSGLASALDQGPLRVALAFVILWSFVLVNLLGIEVYERALVTLMFLMFVGGGIVIPAGFLFTQAEFASAVAAREGVDVAAAAAVVPDPWTLLAATTLLFSSFIGFDSIAQAGGEAKNPNRSLPLAIGIAVLVVATYYLLFTAAVYHVVPWSFVAERARTTDLTAPGLLGYVLAPGWSVAILAGAAIALLNDLPAMLLSVSRLLFAWGEDGIFPRALAAVNARWHTPHVAILASGLTASVGILGSYLAGDFFLGVDILVVAMLVNFILMCVSVLALPVRNPALAREIRFGKSRRAQSVVGGVGAAFLAVLLVSEVVKDLRAEASAWYLHSTYVYLLVMGVAAVTFAWRWRNLSREARLSFLSLPPA